MTGRFLAAGAAALMSMMVLLLGPGMAAGLSCAPDEDALTFHEMIDQGTTGEDRYPIMFLGVGRSLNDRGGDPGGGRTIARLEVVEHPVGYAPAEARVRFWRDLPGSESFRFEFKPRGRYVVIAQRLGDASFRFDGDCGETRSVDRETFRELVRYARSHHR